MNEMTEPKPQYLTTALTWTNVTVKLSQLEPWADNPKTSTAKNAKQLKTSKDELGQFQTVAIEPTDNPDKFRVADGHQRLSAWLLAYGKDFEVKALLASRPLSETERRKVSIYSRQIGLFNFDTISGWDEPLIDWGLDADTLADWGKQYGELAAMLGAEAVDYDAEWQGMPEFEQEENGAYRTLKVHFATEEDLQNFSKDIDQPISDKAIYIWYPKQVREDLKKYRVADES